MQMVKCNVKDSTEYTEIQEFLPSPVATAKMRAFKVKDNPKSESLSSSQCLSKPPRSIPLLEYAHNTGVRR